MSQVARGLTPAKPATFFDSIHVDPVQELGTIGVAIPAYNAAKFLRRALHSVWAQQNPLAQVIVVDDGSTDDTHKVVEAFTAELALHFEQQSQTGRVLGVSPSESLYCERTNASAAPSSPENPPFGPMSVRCIRTANTGAGAARNLAVKNLNTEFIAFLDADDEWHPHWLANVLANGLDSRTDLLFGTLRNQVQSNLDPQKFRIPAQTDAPLTSSTVVKRSALAQFGPFTDDSYSWITWLAGARQQGLTEDFLHINTKPVEAGIRWITGENITLRHDSSSQYLQMVRTLISQRWATADPISPEKY